jgi:hypothetical protein
MYTLIFEEVRAEKTIAIGYSYTFVLATGLALPADEILEFGCTKGIW